MVLAFWLLPHRFRSIFLLVASLFFYMNWLPIYGFLIAALTVTNYLLGQAISRGNRSGLYLTVGIIFNLAILSYYKYADFAIESWNKATLTFGPLLQLQPQAISFPLQHILLPLGISFFVFEFIHYLTDVYKGSKPIANFVNFSLFASFFPSQIAGPIKRYQDFIRQLDCPRVFSAEALERGLRLILQGLFKKVAIADNLAPIVSAGFSNASTLGGLEAWVAACAFAVQIYCDFSGYTDMGRGSAIMLGFDLPDNFNWPYIAKNLPDFWKRWHISLSSWLRDYLYIPLGGSKCSVSRRHSNLMITMLLGGLWHGASWHYVVWGAFHGIGLVFCHSYDALVKRESAIAGALRKFHGTSIGVALSLLLTFLFVLVGWVFFRADTIAQSLQVLQAMCSFHSSTCLAESIEKYPVLTAASVYLIGRLLVDNKKRLGLLAPTLRENLQPLMPARLVVYICFFICAIGLSPSGKTPFIYFQF
jgi:alginate O-acetyltransferase complex protein AlgI